MLDAFLSAAYEQKQAAEQERALGRAMRVLPVGDLYKLATGGKTAYSSEGDLNWLDRFKGTPLFEQAIGLEQEGIQLEMAEKQQGEQSRAMWDMRDQICLKKRLLNIQLAQHEQQQLGGSAGLPAADAAPTPPGASPSPATSSPTPGSPTADMGQPPGTPKSVTVKMSSSFPEKAKTWSQFLGRGAGGLEEVVRGGKPGRAIEGGLRQAASDFSHGREEGKHKVRVRRHEMEEEHKKASAFPDAIALGRELARADAEKIASQRAAIEGARAMGRRMAKQGFDWGAAGKTVLDTAAKHPGAIAGGVLGAGAGYLSSDPRQGDSTLGRMAIGGLGGAGLGLGAHRIGGAISAGTPVGEAFMNAGRELKDSAGRAVDAVHARLSPNAKAMQQAQVLKNI